MYAQQVAPLRCTVQPLRCARRGFLVEALRGVPALSGVMRAFSGVRLYVFAVWR